MSTPSLLFGRSMTCPTEAFTWKSLPKYFSSVRALAGDSTMTRFFAMPLFLSGDFSYVNQGGNEVFPGQLLHGALQLQSQEPLQHGRRRQTAARDDGIDVHRFMAHASEHRSVRGAGHH